MFKEMRQLQGKAGGPTSMILAGVHGDEYVGVKVMEEVLPALEIERGRVLYGCGNPRALAAGTRYTEANLNRIFLPEHSLSAEEQASYEYKRLQFLKRSLDSASALLDLHTTTIPDSASFLICEANAAGIAEYIPVDYVVSGFDEVEPGGTDYYMNRIGKVGMCLECGSFDDPKARKVAEEGIRAFLQARGHIGGSPTPRNQAYAQVTEKYYSTTGSFRLATPFENFEPVSANQLIGTDGMEEVRAGRDGFILFANNCEHAGEEAFLLGVKKEGLA